MASKHRKWKIWISSLHWNILHNGSAVVQESVQAFLPAFLFFRFFWCTLYIIFFRGWAYGQSVRAPWGLSRLCWKYYRRMPQKGCRVHKPYLKKAGILQIDDYEQSHKTKIHFRTRLPKENRIVILVVFDSWKSVKNWQSSEIFSTRKFSIIALLFYCPLISVSRTGVKKYMS